MYTDINFKSAAELKRAVKAGTVVCVHQPGLGEVPENGDVSLEGPHYPAAHSWYAIATLENFLVVKVR